MKKNSDGDRMSQIKRSELALGDNWRFSNCGGLKQRPTIISRREQTRAQVRAGGIGRKHDYSTCGWIIHESRRKQYAGNDEELIISGMSKCGRINIKRGRLPASQSVPSHPSPVPSPISSHPHPISSHPHPTPSWILHQLTAAARYTPESLRCYRRAFRPNVPMYV